MVQLESSRLDSLFGALADPTRRSMLRALAVGEQSIGALAEPFDMSFAAASKHVRVLETAGLIRRDVRGRSHICSLQPGPLAAASEWLAFNRALWTERFDALDAVLIEAKE